MSNIRRGVFLGLALCAFGCRGSGYWIDRWEADSLHLRVVQLGSSETCFHLVPMGLVRSFPIPIIENGRGVFKVLYYPTELRQNRSIVLTPLYEGVFLADSMDDDHCAILPTAKSVELGFAESKNLSTADYYRMHARLYRDLDRSAALYFSGAAPNAKNVKTLAEFWNVFNALAEPGLLPDYYRLSPGFWEWLRVYIGHSIPKS